MIRSRFYTTSADPRPVNWPIKHPYWVTGFASDGSYSTIVAYADDEAELLTNWPEAVDIDSTEADTYTFTDRFPQPKWFAPKDQS